MLGNPSKPALPLFPIIAMIVCVRQATPTAERRRDSTASGTSLKMAIFNPMTCGNAEEVLAALAAGADLTVTSDQEEAALAIIQNLPRDAFIRDVVDSC